MSNPSILDMLNKKAKTETPVVEEKPKDNVSFTNIKNSLGNISVADTAANVAKPVVSEPVPADTTGAETSLLTEGLDVEALANLKVDDVDISRPSFLQKQFEEEISLEFSTPEQKEAYEKEQLDKLNEALHSLKESLDDKELVSNVVRFVFSHLQEHEFLKDLVEPEDIGLMVAGLRESYGVAIAKKTERKSKRADNAKQVDDITKQLEDQLGI